jgi:uncharacterized protein involved in type VI secretion and phage assembly
MTLVAAAPRETALEAGGHVKGVCVAIVSDNQDDSGQHRVKVNYPWHSEPKQSYWARVAMPMAGPDRGLCFLPEVGDEVLVAFERGDLRFPYVVGSLWNGQERAPVSNANGNNDQRVIHTRKGHKLVFDDGAKGLVRLQLNDGKQLSIDDDGVRLEDGHGNQLVIASASGAVTLEAKGTLKLKGASVEIEASGTLNAKAGATLGLRGTAINLN